MKYKKEMFLIAGFAAVFIFGNFSSWSEKVHKDPRRLIQKMEQAIGGVENLKALKDVQYTYTYRDNKEGKTDISIERYIFDGELSWAKYTTREKFVLPEQKGEVIQGFDGKQSWVTLDGKAIEDPQVVKMADFMRKTNYYWFAMMFKLSDPGVKYVYKGQRTANGINYDLVEITYEQGIGDVADIYLLYINPKTHLVDQFLFTVMDFGMKDPFLMTVDYEEAEGIKLPAKRRYIKSNWDGKILSEKWTDEIMEDIKFKNGFDKGMFAKP